MNSDLWGRKFNVENDHWRQSRVDAEGRGQALRFASLYISPLHSSNSSAGCWEKYASGRCDWSAGKRGPTFRLYIISFSSQEVLVLYLEDKTWITIEVIHFSLSHICTQVFTNSWHSGVGGIGGRKPEVLYKQLQLHCSEITSPRPAQIIAKDILQPSDRRSCSTRKPNPSAMVMMTAKRDWIFSWPISFRFRIKAYYDIQMVHLFFTHFGTLVR